MDLSAKRVYLSKSNHSNPDRVSRVRKWLEDRRYQVIEHKGGSYNQNLLFMAKMMIMVGPADYEDGQSTVDVGKGQYEQLSSRNNHNNGYNYFVTAFDCTGDPILRVVKLNGTYKDSDNWVRYGRLKIGNSTVVAPYTRPRPTVEYAENDFEEIDLVQDYGKAPTAHLAAYTFLFT